MREIKHEFTYLLRRSIIVYLMTFANCQMLFFLISERWGGQF